MNHWLLKSEPAVFSWSDLLAAPDRTTSWDGVRNYAARNFLRAMKLGDLAFFYHSSAEPNAIVGVVEIVREAYADETQFDRRSEYFEKRATRAEPVWSTVDIRVREGLPRPVSLADLRAVPALEKMELLRKGSRLSVTAVTAGEWAAVRALAGFSSG